MALYDELMAFRAFEDVAGSVPLTDRERSLVLATLAFADDKIGRLRLNISRLRGQVRQRELEGELEYSRLETRMALFLAGVGSAGLSAARLLVTPYSEMKLLPRTKASHDDTELDAVSAAAVPIAMTSKQPNDTTELLHTGRHPLDAPDPIQVSITDKPALEGMPSILRWPALILMCIISKLSPAVSAVLIVMVVAGAIVYGEHARTSVEEDYKLVSTELELKRSRLDTVDGELKDRNERIVELESRVRHLEPLRGSLAEAEEAMATANAALAAAQETHREELERIGNLHSTQVETLRAGLEQTTRNQIAEAEQRNGRLEGELLGVQDERDRLAGRVQELGNDLRLAERLSAQAEEGQRSLREQVMALSERNAQLEQENTDFQSVLVYSRAVSSELSTALQYLHDAHYKTRALEIRDRVRTLWDNRKDEMRRARIQRVSY